MTSTELVPHSGVLALPENEQREILLALDLDVRSPLTKALLLVAERYDLDPLLKQVQIIKGSVYITHKGLLHIAHTSGKLDGIVVESEWDDKEWYRAKVSVYRKDMAHPFTFQGKFRKSKVRSDGASGEEMALKNAERAALGRAFDVSAPTMDDSGDDFDTVIPQGDIDLPSDKPALPDASTNALPVPNNIPPAESDMPSPGGVKIVKMPEGTRKLVVPETGEIALLSPNGHLVNPDTGGEVMAATEEQQALQARAREIVKQAEADLEKKVPTPGAKRVAKAVTKKAAAKASAEPEYTEEQIKRGQSLHMKAKELGIEETLMRDIVYAITEKRTRSTREVGQDEADTVKAVMTAISGDLMELDYDEEGVLKFEMMDNPLPPDGAEVDITDAEVVNEPTDWKHEASVRNIKDAVFLRKARALADELEIELPSSFKDIGGEKLEAALWEWLSEVSEV